MGSVGGMRQGLIVANVAVLLFGLAGVLGKLSALSAPTIACGRVAFAMPALVLVAWPRRVPLCPRTRRDLMLLVAQGLLLALHWTAFFESIVVSSVAIGLLSFSTFPLFAAALEAVLLRQRPDGAQLGAAVLILPGVALLSPGLGVADATSAGIAWGLLAGATFALLSVVNRWLGRRYESLAISLYQDGVALVALLPIVALSHATSNVWSVRSLLLLAALGVGCTALAHTLYIEALRTITAQLASLLASLEPVWGIVFALLLLGEHPSARVLAGGALILGATLVPAALRLRQRGTLSSKRARAERTMTSSASSSAD